MFGIEVLVIACLAVALVTAREGDELPACTLRIHREMQDSHAS